MIDGADFLKWLNFFNVPNGGGGGGGVTAQEVQRSAFNYTPAAGVNDAFVVTLNPAVTMLTNGLLISFNAGLLTNLTTTPTLQVNALAPVDITTFSGNVAPGDIQPGITYLFVYNSTYNEFQLLNPSLSLANSFLVQNNYYNFAVDTGIANEYIVDLPIFVDVSNGFSVLMKATNTNTGACHVTVNGNFYELIYPNGESLQGGEVQAGGYYLMYYSTTASRMILGNPSYPVRGQTVVVTGNSTATSMGYTYIIDYSLGQCTVNLQHAEDHEIGETITVIGLSDGGWMAELTGTGDVIINGEDISTPTTGTIYSDVGSDTMTLMIVDNTPGSGKWKVVAQQSAGLTTT